LEQENIYDDIKDLAIENNANKIDQIIDNNIAKKSWHMYGSSKSPSSEPYLVTRFFNEEGEPFTIEEMFNDEYTKMIDVDPELSQHSIDYYLPIFLSIRDTRLFFGEVEDDEPERGVVLSDYVLGKKDFYVATKKRTIPKVRNEEQILEDIKLIQEGEIMDMLSDSRASDYHQWISVGWTLFNIGEGHEDTLNLWITFSQRSEKYLEGECEELWRGMQLRNMSLGSLLYMAKLDSPELFKKWKQRNTRYLMEESLKEAKPNEYDISRVVQKLFGDRFVLGYISKSTEEWYEFRDHKWNIVPNAITLKRNFCDIVTAEYHQFAAWYTIEKTKKDPVTQQDEIKHINDKLKKISSIITALKTGIFHKHLLGMCQIIGFYDEKFMDKLDTNRYLIGCANGVLDLTEGIFRDGRPDDYISMSTNIHYTNFDKNGQDVKELKDFLKKVHVDKPRRKYFKDIMCSTLRGGNVNKHVIIHTGEGGGGKSITMKLAELTFGDYCMKFDRNLILVGDKNSSGGAKPELARSRGKRLAIIDEITHKEKINIGMVKMLSGNDSIPARDLYQTGKSVKELTPFFSLFIQCNSPPQVPEDDEATWDRLKLLDYLSKFVKPDQYSEFPVPKSEKEQFKLKRFKADLSFGDRLKEIAPVFLWYLFDRYVNKYKIRGVVEPKEVKMSTLALKSKNDQYSQFISEVLENCGVTGEFVLFADLFEKYKIWFTSTFAGCSLRGINRFAFKFEMEKKLKSKVNRGKIYNWKLKEEEVEDDEGEVKGQAVPENEEEIEEEGDE
jgi:phage/plasmid-associated DNA primase